MVAIKKRILVVDDEAIVRESCKLALTDAGYAVRTVASGRDAIQACRAEPFDVMLADLRMPDMDGLEVARIVANEFPEVRVVIITGYPSKASAEQAANLGIFDYLEKPLNPDRLSEATAAVLARRPRPKTTNLQSGEPDTKTMPEAQPAAADTEAAIADSVGVPEPAESRTAQSAETDMGLVKGLALVAVAPLIGLAYVLLFPIVGFAVLCGVLGMGVAEKLGWARK